MNDHDPLEETESAEPSPPIDGAEHVAASAEVRASPVATVEDRNWSVAAHLVGFAGFLMPFSDMVAAFGLMITKGQDSEFIREHAKESLNFQISTAIYSVVSAILCVIGIGFLLLPMVLIFQVVMLLRAASAASRGETFQYPLCLRLVN